MPNLRDGAGRLDVELMERRLGCVRAAYVCQVCGAQWRQAVEPDRCPECRTVEYDVPPPIPLLLEDEPVPRRQRLVRIGLALITAAAAGYMLGRLILWPLLSAALT